MAVTEMISMVAVALFMLTAFVFFLKMIQAWMLHRTLRDAIKRDSATAAGLVDKIDRSGGDDVQRLGGDDRNGLVLIAIGLALLGFALVVDDPEWLRYGLGASLFPMLVGFALVGRHLWLRKVLERDLAAGS
jgi:hypothetical protein